MNLLLPLLAVAMLLTIDESDACGFSMGGGGGGCCSPPPAMTSCCGGGGGGCRCRVKRRVTVPHAKRGVRQHVTSLHDSEHDDPFCSNAQLKHIMSKNMVGDPSVSRELIHQVITDESIVHMAVICSLGSFAYTVDSKLYCQHTNATTGETCYAFEF